MNFGWDLTTSYGRDTALHEIGHALGFPHEHQNPNSGIEWNVLRPLDPAEVEGSDWDPHSIMHYWFPAGLIRQPAEFAGGLEPDPGLTDTDVQEARRFYPGLDGDDDSGWNRNARIAHRLERDHRYLLRLRPYYAAIGGQTAVFMY